MNKKQLPNFLIVGMAKCGTSSLSQYLQQHPDVFISKRKEPRFITSQCMPFPMNGPKDHLVEDWYVKSFDDYTALFKHTDAKAIGEASADTLYFHKGSIPVIKKYFDEPKIIIILRNPVKRAFSAYQHLVRDEREFLPFEEALEKEPHRISDNWELIYHYRTAGRYYEPVKAFMSEFNQVKVILSEDLKNSPQETLAEIFNFLEVDPSFQVETHLEFNVSGKPKNRKLHESLQGETTLRKAVRPLARMLFPSEKTRTSVVNWLSRKNLDRMQIAPETKSQLMEEFKEDIEKTGQLINKDLSEWMNGD